MLSLFLVFNLYSKLRTFFFTSYNGTDFHGWQIQHNALTVQQEIESAFQTILQSPVSIVGSGRTDAGVHATEQVFHADLIENIDLAELKFKLNCLLPQSIAINHIKKVKPESHARFDAVLRTYHYFIHPNKDPFKGGSSYFFRKPLNVDLMNEACHILIGEHDFESFSKVKTDVNHFNCIIEKAGWQNDSKSLVFEISANRFLRGMVRAVVGTMLEIGLKRISISDFKNIIESKDRQQAGRSVPAHGLYLTGVEYPSEIFL